MLNRFIHVFKSMRGYHSLKNKINTCYLVSLKKEEFIFEVIKASP